MNKAEKFWIDNQNIVEKGENIFRKFHEHHDDILDKNGDLIKGGGFIFQDDFDQDQCIKCGKTHGSLKYSIDVDLDFNGKSNYHKDFEDSFTGYLSMGIHCMKKLGIWKDAKAYIDLRNKYEQLKKEVA